MSPNSQIDTTLSDNAEANKRTTPLVEPTNITVVIDAAGIWTTHCLGDSAVTTVGAALRNLRNEGWSLWGIFMEGMHFLTRIDRNYIMIPEGDFIDLSGRAPDSEHVSNRLAEIRDKGVQDSEIFAAGIEHLSGPRAPSAYADRLGELRDKGVQDSEIFAAGIEHLGGPKVPSVFADRLRRLKEAAHTDLEIYCAGVAYLTNLPPGVEWELSGHDEDVHRPFPDMPSVEHADVTTPTVPLGTKGQEFNEGYTP
jgi:hypothetical protein